MDNVIELNTQGKVRPSPARQHRSTEALATCAVKWIARRLDDYADGELSAETIVRQLVELEMVLKELRVAIKAEAAQ